MQNTILFILMFSAALGAQASSPTMPSPQRADTWAATDARGRRLPNHAAVGDLDQDKYVGIFYFLWLGAHGHDEHSPPLDPQGVYPKEAGRDYQGPYDISQILEDNPADPAYGPVKAFHHWAEPHFGYYLSDDEWVIARHAQLLSDAGVDMVAFDVTNAVVYLPIALRVCRVFARLQRMGWSVPKVAFLTNSKHVPTTEAIYRDFYRAELYPELWFRWKGRPLLMGNPEGLSAEIKDFFTFRRSWAWTEGHEWFGDGKDKWPWLDHYPQNYGWHDDPDTPEQIVVSTAQHPISNIGRSYHGGRQPAPDSTDAGAGWFFAEQWERALVIDPEFVFITGWNEWVAMRFNDGRAKQIMGKPIVKGETFFVDQYNEEFSRDIEPMKGGFGDNYYYQMVDGIRRFKGVRPAPSSAEDQNIAVDGSFGDWETVSAVYHDHEGDNQHRNHPGWGRIAAYRNVSGRHDLLEARAARDGDWLAFYLRIGKAFGAKGRTDGPRLLLKVPGARAHDKLDYTHRLTPTQMSVNVAGVPDAAMRVEIVDGQGRWTTRGEIPVRYAGNELELKIPFAFLPGLKDRLEFKWTDNVGDDPSAMDFYDKGDVAPNARFNYVFHLSK